MSTIPYYVTVQHIREVTLIGRADFAYWQAALARENLVTANVDGHAKIVISAPALRFMGVSFRELSISVAIADPRLPPGADAVFMPLAFNSFSPFAWFERNSFATPYYAADITMESQLPASMELAQRKKILFRAGMSRTERPARHGAEGFEGPIYLPSLKSKNAADKLFLACICGATTSYPYLPDDMLTIAPDDRSPTFQALLTSHFTPIEWIVRPDATHSKSKTMARV